jgi:hypothetical protein
VDGFTGTVDLSGEYDALGSASSVQSNLTDHEDATTNVHGIADTSQLIIEGDARLTNQRVPVDLSVTDAKVAADADIAPTKINGTAVVDNDPRLTDQRVPTDGSVTDAKITAGGLSPSSVTGTAVIDSDARLSDERTPVDGSVTTAKIDAAGIAPSAVTGTAVIDNDARLSDNRTPVDGSVTDVKVASGADISPTKIAGTAVIDSDARLSDERTPTDGSVTNAKVAAGAAIDQSKIDGLTASLDGKANLVSGKVPQSELPAIALTEVDVVADIPARDALSPQEGDVAVVQDTGAGDASTFIYDGTAWQELLTPGSGITAVTASQGLASTGGTAPEITIVDGGVTNVKLAGGIDPTKVTGTAVVDADARLSEGAASAETVRSLGTGATQALPGDYDVAGQAPVQSVNTQTGNVTLTASDVSAYPDTNPSNFIDAAGAPVQSVDGLTGAVDLSGNYDVLGAAASVQSNLTAHINDTANPHSVTASQVGLGNVPNLDTTDAVNKAHDQNTDTALDSGGANEVTAADIRAHIDATDNPHSVTKAQVGLGDVDNVSAADLRDRATHTGTQTLATISDAGTMASQDAGSVSITGGSIDAAIDYDNANSSLSAALVQTAIDELDDKKLNVSDLSASVKFFATSAAGAVAGYGKLVIDTGDADFDDPAVAVTVGPFSGSDNLLGSLVSDAGVLVGNTTSINVTTIGNVRRSSGNQNDAAEFYFEVYKRDSGGTETLIGTSSNSKSVSSATFQEFFADALIDDTNFTATDRVVVKFYGSVVNGPGGRTYEFQYGGNQPVRTLFPVPVTVVPTDQTAAQVQVDASGFAGLLSGTDDDVQAALGTLDGVTKSDIGLGNVDNTADLDKPISTATQSALDDKADNTITVTGTNGLQGGGDLTAARTLELTASALASLNLADSALQSGDPATDIAYDNTASGLTATTVQGAIDEIVGILANVLELNTGS